MNDQDITFKTNSDGSILAWPAPTGPATEVNRPLEERLQYYSATHTLKVDYSLFVPKKETVELILEAWDEAQCNLVVDEDSYYAYPIDPSWTYSDIYSY